MTLLLPLKFKLPLLRKFSWWKFNRGKKGMVIPISESKSNDALTLTDVEQAPDFEAYCVTCKKETKWKMVIVDSDTMSMICKKCNK